MDNFLTLASMAPEPPFLENDQGWTFFLETTEISPSVWKGAVRIHTGESELTSRIRSSIDRPNEAAALQDAKDFAFIVYEKINEKLRIAEELERKNSDC